MGEKEHTKSGFITRLRDILGTSNTAELSRITGVPYNTLKNYADGERLPNVEVLITIAENTEINLHWLLTGQGMRFVRNPRPTELPEKVDDVYYSVNSKDIVLEIPATRLRIKLVSDDAEGQDNNEIEETVIKEIPVFEMTRTEDFDKRSLPRPQTPLRLRSIEEDVTDNKSTT